MMKTAFKNLFFDKEVADKVKEAKLNKNILYNLLYSGKITLEEYLSAEKKAN